MPRLEKLALHDTKDTEFRPSYRPTLLDHWTWDWYLPELVTFQATMMSSEAKFSFRMLRCFPKLSELELEFATLEDEPPHQIEVLPALSNVAEDIFPALKILGMRGRFILQPEDLQILMRRALPSLWWFYIWVSDSCPAEQVLAHTRGHPSLTNVILCGELPDAARQKELGLKVYSDDIRIDPKVRPILYEFIKFQHGLKRFMLQERQQKWWKRLWHAYTEYD
ncbi:hypothetical protein BGZ73_008531 [Actinomortierella ambigua]|nr:hypothetical protein BGZ73_008531 [Actinomortierella ambigua]